MASAGTVDPGGQIIAALEFHGTNLGAVDGSRWSNGGGDTGTTIRLDTNRLDLISGTTIGANSFLWQTQLLRGPNQGVLALVVPSGGACVVCRAASTTWQTLKPIPNSSYGCEITTGGAMTLGGGSGATTPSPP